MQHSIAKSHLGLGLPWNELQDFLAVARAGQISRAASLLGVDATTVARRLRRLEVRLGQTLFEQTRAGQVLTAAGEALLIHVEQMHVTAEQIRETPNGSAKPSGLLRISVSEGFGTWFVAAHLKEFHGRYPDITIDIAATTGFLSPSKREADLAILLARPRTGPVVSGKLTDYCLRLYGAETYLESGVYIAQLEDLAGHSLIGYIPDLIYAPELRYLGEIDQQLVPTIRSSSINAQHRLIASGLGLGVLPRFIGDADPSLRPILPDRQITRSFWMVTHKDTRQLQRVRLFREWLSDLVSRQGERLTGARRR